MLDGSEPAALSGECKYHVRNGFLWHTQLPDGSYRQQRLENSLLELYYEDARTIVEEVHSDLKEFTGDTPQSDDITMLVVKRIKEE